MLPREQRIPTAIPRELDHRDLVVQGGNHVRGQLLLVRNEKTHLHEKSLPTHQLIKKGMLRSRRFDHTDCPYSKSRPCRSRRQPVPTGRQYHWSFLYGVRPRRKAVGGIEGSHPTPLKSGTIGEPQQCLRRRTASHGASVACREVARFSQSIRGS